jgi:ketosteroid isomerase-like protein
MRILIAFLLVAVNAHAGAAEDARAADHQALRELLATMTTALNEQKLDEVAKHLDQDFSLTFVDQVVISDVAGLKAYFARWLGPDSTLASVRFAPKVERPAIFFAGDTAFASGISEDVHTLKDGRGGVMPVRWTATVTRRGDAWKVVTLHVGVSLLDNPVLTMAKDAARQGALIAGLVAGVVGAALGALLMLVRRRKPA